MPPTIVNKNIKKLYNLIVEAAQKHEDLYEDKIKNFVRKLPSDIKSEVISTPCFIEDKVYESISAFSRCIYYNAPFDFIEFLMYQGALVNEKYGSAVEVYRGSETPLEFFMKNYNDYAVEDVEAFVKHGAEITSIILQMITEKYPSKVDDILKLAAVVEEQKNERESKESAVENPEVNLKNAIKNNDLALVRSMIDNGVKVNGKLGKNDTALCFAIKELGPNSFEMVRLLVERGNCDVNEKMFDTKEDEYFTPIEIAIHHNLEVVKFLINHGAVLSRSAFLTVNENQPELILFALEKNAIDIDIFDAAQALNYDVLKILIERDPHSVNKISRQNETTLLQLFQSYSLSHEPAERSAAVRCIQLLIANGADINIKGNIIVRVLMGTSRDKYDDIDPELLLLVRRIDPNLIDPKILLFETDYKKLKFLLDLGINPNVKDESGNTPLIQLIQYGDNALPYIKLLVHAGININTKNKKGQTALSLSAGKCPKIYEFLSQKNHYHPQIGKDTQYHNGMAIGDPTAPYQIPMSKQFVQKTQYRPLPLNNEELRVHLQTNPKPHVVFSCPVGHLHSREDCGVPLELRVCNEGDHCPFIVGGTHHFLAPGNYVVYHDGYDHANVWYGDFPVFDYPAYELLVEQYNLAAAKVDLPRIEPVAEQGFTNIARLSDIPVAEGTECPMCGDELQVGKTYVIPDCGHPICETCLTRIRGGNIANINVGTAENFQRRRCGVCSQRFRFGGVPKKYKLHSSSSSNNCSIM